MNRDDQTITDQTQTQHGSRRRFVGIVLLFTLLGPLFGTLAVFGWLGVQAAGAELVAGEWGRILPTVAASLLIGPLFGLPLGYLSGSVPALFVGLAVAVRDRRAGMISSRTALCAALLVWLGSMTVVGKLMASSDSTLTWLGATLFACLLAAALCSRFAAKLFR